jgi:hypothetical protein
VSEECVNTIAAYGMYTMADGQKGACKDFIDLDRYAVLSGIMDYGPESAVDLAERGEAVKTTAAPAPRRIRAGGRRR